MVGCMRRIEGGRWHGGHGRPALSSPLLTHLRAPESLPAGRGDAMTAPAAAEPSFVRLTLPFYF